MDIRKKQVETDFAEEAETRIEVRENVRERDFHM